MVDVTFPLEDAALVSSLIHLDIVSHSVNLFSLFCVFLVFINMDFYLVSKVLDQNGGITANVG